MELEASQSYANFRAWVPRKEVCIGILHPTTWRYYDWGPRTYPEPIVCLHSLIGSAESFFPQLIALPPRGFRLLSVQIPVYWSVPEFCDAFHAFLDTIPHRRLHLYGAGLGGFLAMHYAVRKPERVASLVLTHSFLATDALNLRVPYSPSVLRWLPDFLVRATMRAILPKGRVALPLANAAEFSIGHTMSGSRDALASHMALSISDSSVLNRLHISHSAITLIDTLDRQPPALELSQLTASQLPEARRAYLKIGGDFPYLSVADDVNVHLIVHLRRHAAKPHTDLAVPAPARPLVLPVATRRRKMIEARRGVEGAKEQDEEVGSAKKAKRVKRSAEELQDAARAVVKANERTRIERYSYEIVRLREFMSDRNDAYLAAVLEECDGVLDVAISNALDEQYEDGFYEKTTERALQETLDRLRREEEEDGVDEHTEADEVSSGEGADVHTADDQRTDVESVSERVGKPLHEENDVANSLDRNDSSYRRQLERDPLGSGEVFDTGTRRGDREDIGESSEQVGVAWDEQEDYSTNNPSGRDVEGTDSPGEQRALGMRDSPQNSAMSSVDLGVDGLVLNSDISQPKDSSDGERAGTGSSAQPPQSETQTQRERRLRRRSYPQAGSPLGDYVTSEKIGMRSEGPFIGRGPAPFRKAAIASYESPGKSWKQSTRINQEDAVSNGDMTQFSLASGASLLDAENNPLELQGPTSPYTSGSSHRKTLSVPAPSGGSASHDHKAFLDTAGSMSGTGTPPPPRRLASAPQLEESSVEGLESILTNGAGEHGDGKGEERRDEWEQFRRPRTGLAGGVPSPPPSSKKDIDAALAEAENNGAGDSEEAARLREWRMSAQAASKSRLR